MNRQDNNIKLDKNTITQKIKKYYKIISKYLNYKILLLIIAIILVVNSYNGYRKQVDKKISVNTKTYLTSVVSDSIEKIRLKVNDEFNILNTISVFFKEETLSKNEINHVLENEMISHELRGVAILNTDGSIEYAYGTIGLNNTNNFIDDALSGKNSISPIVFDEPSDSSYIELAVPIYDEDNIKGVVVCDYDINLFTDIIDTSSFEKVGTTFISQEDGILVSRPESIGNKTNLFVLLDSINIDDEASIKRLKNCIKNNESGILTYGSGKHKRYICYNVIPDTEWYSVSIVSSNVIEPVAKNVSELASGLAAEIISIFVIYILIIVMIDLQKRIRTKKTEQKNK